MRHGAWRAGGKSIVTEREQKELAEMRARLGIDSGDGDVDLSKK